MNTINDGGPAFPVPMFTRQADGQPMSSVEFEMGGMSLRDWFAGRAMAAGLTNGRLPEMKLERDKILTMLGSVSYEIADAMIKARDERKEQE